MRHLGLSLEEITWISFVLPLGSLLGPPLVGAAADKLAHYRLITVASMVLGALSYTALLFVPHVSRAEPRPANLSFLCDHNGSALVFPSCGSHCPTPYLDTTFRIDNCHHVCPSDSDAGSPQSQVHHPQPTHLCLNSTTLSPNADFSECLLMKRPSDHLIFNRTVARHYHRPHPYHHGGGEGPQGKVCTYPQISFTVVPPQDVSPDEVVEVVVPESEFQAPPAGKYSGLTCPTLSGCHVVCDAQEVLQVNGTQILPLPMCTEPLGNSDLTFWLYFGFRFLSELFPAILVSLLDAVALTMVAQHDGDYGREKMWGLLAFGTFAPLCGFLMDVKNEGYGPVFYVFDGLMFLSCLLTLALPFRVEVHRQSMLKNLRQLVRTGELCALLLVMTLLGTFWGYIETFMYMQLEEELGASKMLLGLTLTMGIVPSLPFMYKSAAVVGVCGHHYLLMLAFLGYCIRCAGLSLIEDPWWCLPLEMLECFTLNLMQVSAATLAYKLAPKSLVATAQGLVWVSHFNIGRCIGTFASGYLINEYGHSAVYQGAAAVAAFCAAAYLGLYHLCIHLRSRQQRQPTRLHAAKTNGAIPNGNYMPLQLSEGRF
ncbi:uncharacterized protein LOC143020328 isoform X2 [Oratosquilla oratoria]